jgi:hypothetical protein
MLVVKSAEIERSEALKTSSLGQVVLVGHKDFAGQREFEEGLTFHNGRSLRGRWVVLLQAS